MARKKLRFSLSEDEYQTLKMWERAGKTEQRMVKRARVILLSAEGKRVEQISKESGLSKQSCSKWRLRFVESGLDGLRDERRRGRPPLYKSEARTKVISLACSKPTDGSNQWSIREIARATGMGSTTVHRILHDGDIKPHKVDYWCGKSPDPEFEEKQGAILGLYLDPPDNALVLAIDEKSQIQALDRTQPVLPLTNGKPKRLTATYRRHGTTCLLAALAVHQGEVDGRCVDRHSHEEFLSFLKYLYRKYPGKQLHVILDNFSAHKHKKVLEWVSHRRRLTLHFTPTYASWLNQIEIWFNIFARDVIKGGVWHSKKELIDQIMHYIKKYNEEKAKPFNWTYSGKLLKI
jgi:putative transposase